ncbi:oligosaccharide flippase family protein [Crocinitomix algicola]|uniref:oligosaccharide flippase family protein n=1 Tax=Crocinitomix algicola TaxID=1740263 RepID=UPI000872560E|nr:oligosaccharide flippase family protein [Crocinitomix algicola]
MKKSKINKFSLDALFNLLSVGLGGVLYILMNTIILETFGEELLGIFNLTYAIYMVLAQIAIFGVHLSVQMHIPSLLRNQEGINNSISASLILSSLISVVLVLVVFPMSGFIANSFGIEELELAIKSCVWGLFFFSMNKVLMAYLNGLRKMQAFAFFTFLRLLLMFLFAALNCYVIEDSSGLVSLFAFTEAILFVGLMIYSLKFFKIRFNNAVQSYIVKHFKFGKQAFLGNLLLDINTRVDVIMLGYLTNEGAVGVYSFVLAVSQGVLQIPVVFRNNINPVITKAAVLKNVSGKLGVILRENISKFYKVIGVIALTTIAFYPLGLLVLGIEENFNTYWLLYAIIVGGIVISAGYQPFTMLFNQMKKPKIQSKLFFYLFLINLVANYVFIGFLGVFGAALGTAISYISLIFLIKFLAKKHFQLYI